MVAGAWRSRHLLRRHGGIDRGVHRGLSSRRMGATGAALPRDAEGHEPRRAGQSIAARAGGLVQTPLLGTRDLGAAGYVDVAGGAGRVGLRKHDRVARPPVRAEVTRQAGGLRYFAAFFAFFALEPIISLMKSYSCCR